jgi:hypothetical protein
VGSAATVLGLDPEEVNRQLAAANGGGHASMGGTTGGDSAPANVFRTRDGREIPLPAGVTAQQVEAIFQKMRSGGGPEALSPEERAVMQQLRGAFGPTGGGRGGEGRLGGRTGTQTGQALMGGDYIVFVLRDGQPTPVKIRTGLTDLDYSEVVSGLTAADTVLILPSAGLVAQQQEMRDRASRMQGLPGVSQNQTVGGPPPGGPGRR